MTESAQVLEEASRVTVSCLLWEHYQEYTQNPSGNVAKNINRKIAENWLFVAVPKGWTFTFSRGSRLLSLSSLCRKSPRPLLELHFTNKDTGKSADIAIQCKRGIYRFDADGASLLSACLRGVLPCMG